MRSAPLEREREIERELLDRLMAEKVKLYVSTGMVCDVNQELSPKPISIYCGTGCSQSLITSDCLAGIGNSDTGHSLALTSVIGGGGDMVVWLHTVFLFKVCWDQSLWWW